LNSIICVATQFLIHVLINFQKNPKIAKNIENPKKYIFNTFAPLVAVARGGDAPPLFRLAEGLPCNFWSFRDCFVIFRLCYCNFNIILLFICFGIVFCIVDVKEKERKK